MCSSRWHSSVVMHSIPRLKLTLWRFHRNKYCVVFLAVPFACLHKLQCFQSHEDLWFLRWRMKIYVSTFTTIVKIRLIIELVPSVLIRFKIISETSVSDSFSVGLCFLRWSQLCLCNVPDIASKCIIA
ncbi:hypothetical protein KC19_3G240000 [Ceratodon purpureus]|uniref:Uncharacterized protein n=1 Tax=Ceratodon purpureus TaxID=3225 RepID=A0A8T0IQH3_CERPU|nr:hypothetical protein KC19_3G240000 [Ceratodon purpureus]